METGYGNTHLEVKDLTFAYPGSDPVIKGLSFSCSGNERVGIIGANGAGKSTLLKLIVGLEPGFDGTITVCGHPVEKKSLKHVREHVGYVFQDSDSQLFMTKVEDDIAFAPKNYGFSPEEVARRVDEAMSAVHIEHLRGRSIHKLSGGEKKLASIATILSIEPDVILMDEPSVALDPRNRRNLISVINELDKLKLIASHDLDFVMDTCSRVILINGGEIVKDGPADEILSDRELLESNGLELPLSMSRR